MTERLQNKNHKHIILISSTILLFFLWMNDTVVFKKPIIHKFIFVFAYVGIATAFIHSFFLEQSAKLFPTFILGFFLIIGSIILLIVVLDIQTVIERGGLDYSFENINEIDYKKSKIVVYRTNGGATVDFGIVVRREREFFPGILYCDELFDKYHMDTVGITLINEQTLQLDDQGKIIKTIDLEH